MWEQMVIYAGFSEINLTTHVTHIGFKGTVWKQVSFDISEFKLMIFLHQAFCHFSVYL